MSDENDPFTEAEKAHQDEIHKCSFCKQIKLLSHTRRRQLRDALLKRTKVNGKPISVRTITAVITGWGVETSLTVVTSHANGGTHANPLSRKCRDEVASAWGVENVE